MLLDTVNVRKKIQRLSRKDAQALVNNLYGVRLITYPQWDYFTEELSDPSRWTTEGAK